ncbi:MAG TPA: SPOR domain-containing protein, partial [Geobacteraceae bacterium]|nr:SPOR domain-containing protein [Geobacteraceae bacterium]
AQAAKKEEPKPVKVAEKAVAAKPAPVAAPPAKKEQKPAAAEDKAKAAKPADKAPVKAPAQAYTVVVGEFTSAEVASVEAKLKKHKIKPVAKHVVQKSRQMTRLYYGVYSDYDAYAADLDKLKQASKGAFAIEKDGRYSLYAGSFSSKALAETEKKRLAAKGLKVELQKASLPIPTVRLTAGPFAGKAAADKVAAQMKGEGLKVKVIPKGK